MMGYKNVGSPETLVSGLAVFYFFGSVINMCSYLHSMVKIQTFSPVFTVEGLHCWGIYWLLFGSFKK